MTIGIFDLSNYAKRAFHAAYRDSGSAQTNDGGLYSAMIRMVLSFIKQDLEKVQLDHCVFAIDFAVDSWRKRIFGNYKSSRSAPDAEWIRHINFLIDILGACGLKSKWVQGLEADDLFGIIPGSFPNDECVIFTNDKDSLQGMSNRVRVFDPYTRTFFTEDDVFRKFGVGPDKVRSYLALMGDAADDIPGLDKIGDKTARKILTGDCSVHDWIRANRKDPAGDIEMYEMCHKLAAICIEDEGLFPWPTITRDDITIGKPDKELFMHLWCTKGKIDIKPHSLFSLIADAHPKGAGFFDD